MRRNVHKGRINYGIAHHELLKRRTANEKTSLLSVLHDCMNFFRESFFFVALDCKVEQEAMKSQKSLVCTTVRRMQACSTDAGVNVQIFV